MAYLSDNTVVYALVTTVAHRTAAGGLAPGANVGGYPRGWTPRHVWGSNTDNSKQRCRLVIPAVNNAMFVSPVGKQFTITDLGTFNVTGAEGEKRPNPAPNT